MAGEERQTAIRHAQNDMANLPPERAATAPAPTQAKEAAPKIGEGHAMGMARLGGHELTQALNAFPDSNVRALEEPGVFGNDNLPQYNPGPETPEPGSYEATMAEYARPSVPQQSKQRGMER